MSFLLGLVFRIMFFIVEIFFRVVIFTGAWLGFFFVHLIDKIILLKWLNISLTMENYPTLYPIYEIFLFALIIGVPILYTGFKLFRMVKKLINDTDVKPSPLPTDISNVFNKGTDMLRKESGDMYKIKPYIAEK